MDFLLRNTLYLKSLVLLVRTKNVEDLQTCPGHCRSGRLAYNFRDPERLTGPILPSPKSRLEHRTKGFPLFDPVAFGLQEGAPGPTAWPFRPSKRGSAPSASPGYP